jgi:ABC-type transport system involved in multi-copper enzyme maturation permease subunit
VTSNAPLAAAPSFRTSAFLVFELSLGQMLWSRRSLFLAFIIGAPVGLGLLLRFIVTLQPSLLPRIEGAELEGVTIFGMMVWLFYVRFVIPVLGVFYGTALIADEVEQKTITYLFTRPIRRSAVLVGKYLAYLAATVLLVLPAVVILYLAVVPLGRGSLGAAFPSLLADLCMLAIGLAAYGAVFALVGTAIKRPIVIGLVFAFGWEPAVLFFPGYLKRMTVGYYLQALVPHSMPADSAVRSALQVFTEVPPLVTSLVALAVITGLTLWLAARTVEVKEYVLEQ